jgi:hypothetical protein
MMTVAAPPNAEFCRSLAGDAVVAFQPMNDLAPQASSPEDAASERREYVIA